MSSFIIAKKVLDLKTPTNPKMLVGVSRSEFSSSSDPKVKILKKHFDYTVDVTFSPNGGSVSPTSKTYVVGKAYGDMPKPTKTNCRFDGWFTAASGGAQYDEQDIASLGVTQLYAHWTEIDFSNGTEYDAVTTSSYKKTGIYSATRYSTLSAVYVDWGDGTMDEVNGNISQLAHEYSSVGTFRVRITDNITNFAPSYNNSTWYNTTSQNRYTFKNMVKTGSHCTSMPSYAFYYCSALSSIGFLSTCWTSLTSLPSYAFYYCTGLTTLSNLPARITTLGGSCFRYCTGLTGIQDLRSTGLTSLYNTYTFANCSNVKEWKFPTSLTGTYFGTYQFYYDTALSSVELPSQLTSIANYCFDYCQQLKSITIPSKVTNIGNYAFRYCYQLSSVTYETTALTSIGSYAFYNDYSLRDINVPDTVKSIGSYAFYSCYSSYADDLVLPSQLTSVGTYAYQYCFSLKHAEIPSSLISIGDYAFMGCRALSSITDYKLFAQTVYQYTFGQTTGTGNTAYTGYNTRGSNILSIYWDATGYENSYWLDTLQNPDKCGYNIQYIDPEHASWCNVTFDARCCGTIDSQREYSKQYGQGKVFARIPTPDTDDDELVFDGWYTGIDGTGTKYTESSTCPQQTSLKLYASWLRKVYDEDFHGYLSVDLNSQWRQSTTQTNPDPSSLLGVYESNSNYHVDNAYAKAYVRLSGYSEVTIYIRSYAESSFDYTLAFNLDTDWTSTSVPFSGSTGVKAHTNNNQQSSQALTAYTKVTYTGINPDTNHFICIIYRKDSSASSGNDRGYLLVDNTLPYTLEQYDTHEMLETSNSGVLAAEGKDTAIKLEQFT